MFLVNAKLEKAVRALMKCHAFAFSPTRSPAGQSAYVRRLTSNAIAAAKCLRPQFDALMSAE
ncbi:hypothetical protein [Pandoraea sputorum]|uniref:hypothetical protein n=1 Tax=Pandoraea sputorum TaxID=93222 RepID=UPI001CD549E8|nr:hypothetical protein [Pandoraea sputorum]